MRLVRVAGVLIIAAVFVSCSDEGLVGRPQDGLVIGGKCEVNEDCVDSKAVRAFDNYRCGPIDYYCLGAKCHAACEDRCTDVAGTATSCQEPRVCAPRRSGESACSMKPVTCETLSDCPVSVPPAAAPGEWACEAGVCVFPGWDYPTK